MNSNPNPKERGAAAARAVTDGDVEFVHGLVKRIVEEVGPGCPCSPQEAARGRLVGEAMELEAGAVVTEERFKCAPRAFLGWIRPGVIVAAPVLALLLLSGTAWRGTHLELVAALLGLAAGVVFLIALLGEFVFQREMLDFAFPKGEAANVVGVLPAAGGEVKRVVIFSGHHDSALEFFWLRRTKHVYYVAVGVLIFSVFFLFAGGLTRTVEALIGAPPRWSTVLNPVGLVLYPLALVFGLVFVEHPPAGTGGSVPGAVDNLSGSALAVAVGRVLRRHPELVPPGVEVRLVSFACEEAGVRGSTRYVRAHLEELKRSGAVCVNFDSIADPEVQIFKTDCNGVVRHSPRVVEALQRAAEAAGVPHRVARFPFGGGGSDALAFSRAGVEAACLYSMRVPSQMVEFYHQRFDTPDKLSREGTRNALVVALASLGFLFED